MSMQGAMRRRRTLRASSGILVPEVDGSVGTTSRVCAVNRVEGDIVHSVNERLVFLSRRLVSTMTFEGEVVSAMQPVLVNADSSCRNEGGVTG